MGDVRSSKPRGMYNRFRIAEDLALCEEVITVNPFASPNKNGAWNEVVDNLNAIPLFNKPTDERACKQRIEDLLTQFRTNDVAKLKRSRTEEQYEQLKSLLREIATAKELSDDTSPPSPTLTPRSLPKSSGKRSFPLSMAEPEPLTHRRDVFLSQQEVKPTVPIAPKPTLVRVVNRDHSANLVAPQVSASPPAVSPAPASKPVVKTGNGPDYVTLLIQQNAKQMELREKELQQARDLREKELEVERTRLEFDDRKWQQHLEHLHQQLDLMRDMFQQQQQLLTAFLKHQSTNDKQQLNSNSIKD